MKQKIQEREIADVVVPAALLTDVGALTEAELSRIHARNDVERRGFVFTGNHDGSDIYLDITQEEKYSVYAGGR